MVLLLSGSAGCGARGFVVEQELIDDATGGSGGGGTGGTTGGRGGSGGGSLGGRGGGGGTGVAAAVDPYNFVTTTLRTCEPGFTWVAGDARPCNFRFNGRCYDDADSVCACACPRDSNSVCVLSGFLADPGNPLMVNCQKR